MKFLASTLPVLLLAISNYLHSREITELSGEIRNLKKEIAHIKLNKVDKEMK